MIVKRTFFYLAFFAAVFFISLAQPANADPLLFNYYLGALPTSDADIDRLARYQALIVQPWEAVVRAPVIEAIKKKNPAILIFAYVPSKSYDVGWQSYPASAVYKDLVIQDNWWLRDTSGKITSDWPGHKNFNLDPAQVTYFVNYIKDHVFSGRSFDGVFWDVVYDGIAFQNGGDLDLNRDGIRDLPGTLDQEWNTRLANLLDTSRRVLGVRYVVFNGSSLPILQSHVNGRMYENFPTPWEAGGSWAGLMNRLLVNKTANPSPQIYFFNANTNNTGDQSDLRAMRFGLGSSLLTDNVYFGYDYGSNDHNQLWYYDEYDAKLGSATGPAVSGGGQTGFATDIWRRDFAHGLVIVNGTKQTQHIDLGGEYETLLSRQDNSVNNGAIASAIDLPAQDSIIMFKTFKTLTNAVFTNGSFVRFYLQNGNRTRNGFFVFEDQYGGGAKIFNGDLDGDGVNEKIVATNRKLDIYSGRGGKWYSDYPFGANGAGVLTIAVGALPARKGLSLVVGLSQGAGNIKIYNYNGTQPTDVYPLGAKYKAGFSVAVCDSGEIVLGTGKGVPAEVVRYNPRTAKIIKRFYPFGSTVTNGLQITCADFNGDKKKEIAAVAQAQTKPLVRAFDINGKKLSEFSIRGTFGKQDVALSAVDINREGKMEIVTMTKN